MASSPGDRGRARSCGSAPAPSWCRSSPRPRAPPSSSRCGPRRSACSPRATPRPMGFATIAAELTRIEYLGAGDAHRGSPRRRHASASRVPRHAARRHGGRRRHRRRLRPASASSCSGLPPHDEPCRPAHAFPLAVARRGDRVSRLFFLYPLSRSSARAFSIRAASTSRSANYAKILGSGFYQRRVTNSLGIGAAATLVTTALARAVRVRLARLPIAGKPALLRSSSLPLVLPCFVCAYALVLLFGRAGFVGQWLRDRRHAVQLDLRRRRHRRGLRADALPLCGAADACRPSSRSTSRSRRRARTSAPRAGAACCDRHACRSCSRRSSPARCWSSSRRWRISACRSCSPRTSRSSRSRPSSCSSARPTDNPASAGVLGVLLVTLTALALLIQRRYLGAAPLRDRRAPLAAAACRRPGGLRSPRALLLDVVARRARAVRRRRGDLAFMKFRGPVLHAQFQPRQFHASCSRARRGRSPTR